ncbi:glycosyltransferase family 87 protein [Pseudonocardia hispaniensis]|uniref:Glycosyltransferase family 87 protein n=1 Tax=Pseudonocardia hispaniensis TaxID=904933 RepID=A0ABW1J7J5_9PSEU
MSDRSPNLAVPNLAVPEPAGPAAPRAAARRTAPHRLIATALVLAALVTTVALHWAHPDALVTLLPSTDMRELHVDFDTFWHSAVALTQGADIYHTQAKLTNLNPPLLTVALTPFALLGPLPAYRLFALLTLLMVAAALWAAARELRLPKRWTAAALLALLGSSPLHGTLVLGQIYGLLLVALVAGWIAQRRGRPVLAAVLYGVGAALKPSLAPLLLLPLVQRRWAALWTGLGSAATATLLGVLVAGPSSGLEWLRIAVAEPVPDTVDNAALPGLAVRFGMPSVVGSAAGVALLLGTLAWLGAHHRRGAGVDPGGTAPWAVVAAGLLTAPIAWHNYLLLLMPGVLVLIAHGARWRPTAAVLLAMPLIPVSWGALWAPANPFAPLGGSLYCAILLGYWAVLLRAAPEPTITVPNRPPLAHARP